MQDAPLEAHERTEHVMHEHDGFVTRVAILISVLAVLAAASGNLEGIEAEKTLASSSEATLQQDEATDAWAEYQADSVKRHLYTIAAEENPSNAAKFAKVAKEQERKQSAIRSRAEGSEAARSRSVQESRRHEGRHHWLTGAATLFEIAIALATVSIITRRQWPWATAAVLGVCGLALAAVPFALL
jgi:hypothetical protein